MEIAFRTLLVMASMGHIPSAITNTGFCFHNPFRNGFCSAVISAPESLQLTTSWWWLISCLAEFGQDFFESRDPCLARYAQAFYPQPAMKWWLPKSRRSPTDSFWFRA